MKLKFVGLYISVGIIAGSLAIRNTEAQVTEPDYDAIVQAQQEHEARLDDHEQRITKNESDITTLQNTPSGSSYNSTIPSSGSSPTSSQNPPSPEPTPVPEPVVVSSFRVIDVSNSEDQDCEYTYSDETTYQWHWKTVEYNQGTKITRTSGNCSDTAIGEIKR